MNTPSSERSLLIDTHILIWYLEGIKLTESEVAIIDAARNGKKLFISAISIWEITLLAERGRIVLNTDIKQWTSKLFNQEGIQMLDLTIDVLMDSCLLPNYEHKDPADRMIIASSRKMNVPLMSYDQKIIDYAKAGYVKMAGL